MAKKKKPVKKAKPAPVPDTALRCEEGDGAYDWVKATVIEGGVRLTYHVPDLAVNGRDGIDDDISDWSDEDIQNVAGSMLGIVKEDRHKIEVNYG